MSFYPPKISAKFHRPLYAGRANGANAVGKSATFVCGAVLRFTLRIEDAAVSEAKFKTNGCGYAVAAAETLAEEIAGRQLADLHGLDKKTLRKKIENRLDDFEPRRRHCLELAVDSLQNAFADYRAARIEEWSGEKALICTCFGVSEETIERVIETESAETVEEVTAVCNAGGGCGSCQFLIQELIDVYWSES